MPPAGMVDEIGTLCALVRADERTLYGQLLRENVADVLRSSFPCFAAEIGNEQVVAFSDHFLREHDSQRPQFHHIATELVAFAQRSLELSPVLLSLLEYEWLLVTVEIDPAPVAPPAGEPTSDTIIAMNPTLRLVVLPFARIPVGRWQDERAGHPCAHALYRTHRHGVTTQALTPRDGLLIDRINGAEGMTVGAFIAAVSDELGGDEVLQWVADGAARTLLHLAHHD